MIGIVINSYPNKKHLVRRDSVYMVQCHIIVLYINLLETYLN